MADSAEAMAGWAVVSAEVMAVAEGTGASQDVSVS
jgi:hypothetical protein